MEKKGRIASTIVFGILVTIAFAVVCVALYSAISILTVDINDPAAILGIAIALAIVLALSVLASIASFVVCIPTLCVCIGNIRKANTKVLKGFNITFVAMAGLTMLITILLVAGLASGTFQRIVDAANNTSSSSSSMIALFYR